jgi:SAM-dependent methyltransferase
VRQDDRTAFDDALLRARTAAYPPGEFVGQESFVRASEVVSLASRAGVAPGVRVLDLCCGVAGPGRLLVAALGCDYLGVDASPAAVAVARERAASAGLTCRFEVAEVPPVPGGPVEVVLLLETMLAFADKDRLLAGVSAALEPAGRFVFTVEEGAPLTAAERERMPDADTVWLAPLPALTASLQRAGLTVRWAEEHSAAHLEIVDAMIAALTAEAPAIAAALGARALDDLVGAHRLWSDWLRTGRVRKFAVLAEKTS